MMMMTILTILGILYLLWATIVDGRMVRKPIIVYEHPNGVQMQTDKLVYEQGEMVKGLIKYCKNRHIEVEFQWSLIDTYLKLFPKKKANVAVGCHELTTDVEVIPFDQYPDTDLYFETVLTYKINEFNTVSVPLRTNTFRVR